MKGFLESNGNTDSKSKRFHTAVVLRFLLYQPTAPPVPLHPLTILTLPNKSQYINTSEPCKILFFPLGICMLMSRLSMSLLKRFRKNLLKIKESLLSCLWSTTSKEKCVENIELDPSKILIKGTGKFGKGQCIPPREKEYASLQLIHIYFDTNTYDKIQRSVKISTERQLGLIGRTMGCFTGFSILSGIKMIYFGLKFCLSLKVSRKGRKILAT